MSHSITYFVVDSGHAKLKSAARKACNFWNHFIVPGRNYVVRIETYKNIFTSTTGIAFKPYEKDGVTYGRVKFNRKFLDKWSIDQAAATLVHEIGHTLGYGWEEWDGLFDRDTGMFHDAAVTRLPALADMRVELDHGDGSRLSHWDEAVFDKELMTPFKDEASHVLPVTIDVMALLGHVLKNRLESQAPLDSLLDLPGQPPSFHKAKSGEIDRGYLEETDIWEPLPPHDPDDLSGSDKG